MRLAGSRHNLRSATRERFSGFHHIYRDDSAHRRGWSLVANLEGLRYVASWVTDDLRRCFQVMECDDPALLHEWMAQWADLVDFEIVPVKTSAEVTPLLAPKI